VRDILFFLQGEGYRKAKLATHLSLSPKSKMDLRFDFTVRFHGVGFMHVSKQRFKELTDNIGGLPNGDVCSEGTLTT
jgi:hypothetical protein